MAARVSPLLLGMHNAGTLMALNAVPTAALPLPRTSTGALDGKCRLMMYPYMRSRGTDQTDSDLAAMVK